MDQDVNKEMYEAIKKVDTYFKALAQAWVDNDGRVTGNRAAIVVGEGLDMLAEEAAMAINNVLPKAEVIYGI